MTAIKDKRRKWNKYLHCKNHITYNEYKTARNKVTLLIKKQKYQQERQIARKIKSDPKMFWKHVRLKRQIQSRVNALEIDGDICTNDKKIAEEVNRYFSSVFTKETLPVPIPSRTIDTTIEDVYITEERLLKAMAEINPSKSQGPDEIHSSFIYETRNTISKPFLSICRKSIAEGKLSKQWKSANITPIHKSGPKHKPENYRPISVTSICCRVMERIIRNVIMEHLEGNNLLHINQHGFRKGRSCTTQLLECIEDFTNSLDDRREIDIIYLDFKSAFDRVPHQR